MKKILIVAMMALVSVRASELATEQKNPWSYSLNHISMSKYYGSIVGGIFYDGPMSFTDVIARRTDATGSNYVDLSVGKSLDSLSYNKDGSSEIDLLLGRSMTFGSADFPVKVDYCFTYLALHDLRKSKGDVVSNDVRIDLPKVLFVQPYLVIYRFDFVGDVAGAGWFVYGGLQRSDRVGTFKGKPVTLGLDYRTGYSSNGLFGASSGHAYHRLSVSLTVELPHGWTVTPTIIGQTSAHGQRPGSAFVDRSRLFATINLSRQL